MFFKAFNPKLDSFTRSVLTRRFDDDVAFRHRARRTCIQTLFPSRLKVLTLLLQTASFGPKPYLSMEWGYIWVSYGELLTDLLGDCPLHCSRPLTCRSTATYEKLPHSALHPFNCMFPCAICSWLNP